MSLPKILSFIFTASGLFFLSLALYLALKHYLPYKLDFKNYQPPKNITAAPGGRAPVRLVISRLGIDLPVEEAVIVNNLWPVSGRAALHLDASPIPGDVGNSVIYGHNWASLLGPLKSARVGDQIEVTLGDAATRLFRVEYLAVVTPDQTHILDQTSDRRLTIYTCVGFLDGKRLVIVALAQPHP